MEVIAELLLGFIVEVVIPLVGELAFEILLHSFGQPFVSRERRNPVFAGIGYFLIGLILGVGWGAVNLYYMLGIVKSDTFGGIELNYVFPVPLALFMIPTILAAAFVAAVGPGESAVRGTLVEALEYE